MHIKRRTCALKIFGFERHITLGYCATFRGEGHEGIRAFTSTLKSFLSFPLDLLIQSHFISSFLFLHVSKKKKKQVSYCAYFIILSIFSYFLFYIIVLSQNFRAVFKMLQVQEDRIARKFDYGTLLYKSRLPKDKILVRLYRHGNQETYLLPLDSHFAPLQRLPTLVDFPHHTDYFHLRVSRSLISLNSQDNSSNCA